ncbi:MAG: hypothetical protein NT140_04685 [Deltaproteobacteria bacterium]|nr:hypothetical protein [Deltaproteobacteria bacterium]
MNLIDWMYLKNMLRRLERKIGKVFDITLSRRIDAVRYLLESADD